MSDDPALQDILEAQAYFRLPSPALVEKDFYVVRALRAIAATNTGPLQLAFGGGTALSRAHRLLDRMSEDIDLKIIGTEPIPRSDLRQLREALTESLKAAGFQFDATDPAFRLSRNTSRYTLFRLPYKPLVSGDAALRPGIQIEIAVWPLRRTSIDLPVSSFIAEAFKRPPEVERVSCVAVTQTAAEKFVALTRRTAIELSGTRGSGDPAYIRHVYDLHMIREHYDLDEVAALAQEIMPRDAEMFDHHSPAYSTNPLAETVRAVEALTSDADYARRYADFCRSMVYGHQPDYVEALATVRKLAERMSKR